MAFQTFVAMTEGAPQPLYSVDSSAFMDWQARFYPVDRTPDEQDAYAVSLWLADMDARGTLARYFAPPLTDLERATAEREVWILGVM